ncbi:hypothetical protein BDDG_05245, partial [Blastomyces dermatitidis ATCC 18188]
SSCIDRSMSADDSEPDVESLIKNLKNMIMKELSVPCVAGSSASSLALSVPFSATPPQSPTPAPVSGSPAPTTPVPATPGFAASAFITSSPHFKEMLHRLNEPHLPVFASVSEIILIKDDNTAETTLFCSQASLITFSLFSAEKVVHTSDHKHSAL